MSLKAFHIFFIIASALLALGLALWGFSHEGESYRSPILGGVGLVVGILLVPYLIWFLKKMRQVVTMIVVSILLCPYELFACAVCFGDPNSLMTKGAKYGVAFLILVVGGVLVAMTMVALSWNRRARALGKWPLSVDHLL